MRMTYRMLFVLESVALLTVVAGAEMTAVSEDSSLDTRSLSAVTAPENQALDTRSFTVDWSEARKLNTKRIVGTMMMLR